MSMENYVVVKDGRWKCEFSYVSGRYWWEFRLHKRCLFWWWKFADFRKDKIVLDEANQIAKDLVNKMNGN